MSVDNAQRPYVVHIRNCPFRHFECSPIARKGLSVKRDILQFLKYGGRGEVTFVRERQNFGGNRLVTRWHNVSSYAGDIGIELQTDESQCGWK